MKLSEMSRKELLDLRKQIDVKLFEMKLSNKKKLLKTKYKDQLSKYSFIIHRFWEEDPESDWHVGFSSQHEGFIDDTWEYMSESEEEKDEIVDALLDIFPHWGESCSCTYHIDFQDIDKVKSVLKDLGMKEAKPAW